ncbi:hypothetical protein [Paenibacillus sp. SI8]|uniref:hypothetical protein n=1 Tax=unclassified Paenibacillus TaxID=185978 RepID=UPI003465183D
MNTNREWSVNEVYQGKPWNYFEVEARKSVADATRIIGFPESEYIVVAGNGDGTFYGEFWVPVVKK